MLPWIEKHRPKNLDEVVGNPEIVKHFKHVRDSGTLQHMLLTGRPGIGKTTTVICLARELLGDKFKYGFLELNTSDQRGIDTVRNGILNFCKKKLTLPENRQKIIFLDEVESMTTVAQQALLRIIEKYTHNTRFILACNSSASLIDALQSRCMLRRFLKITDEEMTTLLLRICEREKVEYDDTGLKSIVLIANGDVRIAVNTLQTVAAAGKVIPENVSRIVDKPNYMIVKQLIKMCTSDQEDAFKKSLEIVNDLIICGYTGLDILKSIFAVTKEYEMDEYAKLQFLERIGESELNIMNGADDEIQLTALVSKLCLLKYEVEYVEVEE